MDRDYEIEGSRQLAVVSISCDDVEDTDEDEGVQVAHNVQAPSQVVSCMEQLTAPPSKIETMNVTNSENVHIGNRTYFNGPVVIKQIYNSKSEGVNNASYEETKGDDLPKKHPSEDLLTSNEINLKPNRCTSLRVWYKVMVAAVLIVVVGIISCILYWKNVELCDDDYGSETISAACNTSNSVDVNAVKVLRIVSRNEWLAQPVEEPLESLTLPVSLVVVAHTATEPCYTQSECMLRARIIQLFHIESRHWSDVGYNFMVGGDGAVYWGRGWRYVGAHTKGYNRVSIGVALIGTFTRTAPPARQIAACLQIIEQGRRAGHLTRDYRVLAHRQLMSTLSPGDALYALMQQWPHFDRTQPSQLQGDNATTTT